MRVAWLLCVAVLPIWGAKCVGPEHIVADGAVDGFHHGPRPAHPSKALLASPAARYPYAPRGFDQDGEDHIFLTSLGLPARKICSASLELRIRRSIAQGSFEFNDALMVGFAPMAPLGPHRQVLVVSPWMGESPDIPEKTLRLWLPAVELNRFILTTSAPHFLDIILHDDTAVDYVKLRLRFE